MSVETSGQDGGDATNAQTADDELVAGSDVDMWSEWVDQLDTASGGGGYAGAVSTGFIDLDHVLCGLRPGHLIIVSGVTGAGCSTLVLNVARHAAMAAGVRVHLASYESPRSDVQDRLVAAAAGVPLHSLRAARLSEQDWRQVAQALSGVAAAPLTVTDQLPESVDAIAAEFVDEPPGLLVVDGAGLLARASEPGLLWAAHYSVAGDLKRLAMRLGIPVLVTCAANRTVLTTQDVGQPRLGAVQAAAAYESEADVIIWVYREDAIARDSQRPGEADLTVVKSRLGQRAVVTVEFQRQYARFVDLVAESPGSGPGPMACARHDGG